jgi:hypothetical protein
MLSGVIDKRRQQLIDDLEAAKEKEYRLNRKVAKQESRIKQLERLEDKFLEKLQIQEDDTGKAAAVEKLNEVKSQLEARILELQSEMLALESRAHAMRGLSVQFQTALSNFSKSSRMVFDIGSSIKKISIGTELNDQLIDCARRADEFAEQLRELAGQGQNLD